MKANTPAEDWVTGYAVSREDLAQYTHLIRSPSDPHRSSGKREDKFPHRTLAKLPPSEIRSLLLGGLADGEPRTFNRPHRYRDRGNPPR